MHSTLKYNIHSFHAMHTLASMHTSCTSSYYYSSRVCIHNIVYYTLSYYIYSRSSSIYELEYNIICILSMYW